MGRRDGPVIINIIEFPPGAIVGVLGKGVQSDATGTKIDVALGDGLTFDANNNIAVNVGQSLTLLNGQVEILPDQVIGNGLEVDANHKVQVKLGDGLEFDPNNAVRLRGHDQLAGKGLVFDNDTGKIDIELGPGLVFDPDNSISVSTVADFEMTLSFSALTDMVMFINGNELTLKKTYTRYDLQRNSAGILVGIADNYQHDLFQTVPLPCGGYGYGGYAMATSNRLGTPEKPNFYKK